MKHQRKFTVLLFLLVVGLLFSANPGLHNPVNQRDLQIKAGEVINIDYKMSAEPNLFLTEGRRQNVPEYVIEHITDDLGISFYDYFPGSYGSFPLVLQPSPAGVYDGGGVYLVYHVTTSAGATRRAYYSYVQDGVVTAGPSMIDLAGTSSDGFPGVDVDYVTGDPFAAWHGANPDNDPIWVVDLSFDQYSMIGMPGLWNSAYTVIDNPAMEDEYIWPVVKVGPSPNPGMRRVYVVGGNAGPVGPATQGMNAYIAFADYSDVSDLATYNSEDWTEYEIPYMRDWAMVNIRPYWDFTITDDGKVIIAGNNFDWGYYEDDNTEGYSENDNLFVLVNSNYGEGSTEDDWDLHLQYANIPVENPDGYFPPDDPEVYENLYVVPFAPRYTVTTNDLGDVIWSCTYRLSATQANSLYPNQGYVKFVRFSFDTEEFTITDLYPRSENLDAQPYVPWDPEGDGTWEYDDEENLILTSSWPLYWWDDDDFQPENFTRITEHENWVIAVFQESMKARYFHQYGYDQYATWSDKPEIYIMISKDYGETWADPIIMHANSQEDNYNPALANMIPSYIYPAQSIEMLDENWLRLHLMFYDQNDYGSYIQGNGPNTGGNLVYLAVDVDKRTDVDDYLISYPSEKLYPNYPNPFNPTTTIRFDLPKAERANLSIYNIKGQLVKTLVDDLISAGEHYVTWNGTDNNNNQVGSGVYFYRLTSDSHDESRKMLLVK